MDRERIEKLIAADCLRAVEDIFGAEGLHKVVEHMGRQNRAREDNAEIDALEQILAGE